MSVCLCTAGPLLTLLVLLEVLPRVEADAGDELLVLVHAAPRRAQVAYAHQVGG